MVWAYVRSSLPGLGSPLVASSPIGAISRHVPRLRGSSHAHIHAEAKRGWTRKTKKKNGSENFERNSYVEKPCQKALQRGWKIDKTICSLKLSKPTLPQKKNHWTIDCKVGENQEPFDKKDEKRASLGVAFSLSKNRLVLYRGLKQENDRGSIFVCLTKKDTRAHLKPEGRGENKKKEPVSFTRNSPYFWQLLCRVRS